MRTATVCGLLAISAVPLTACTAPSQRPKVAQGGIEIDAVAANPSQHTVLLENEHVRVIRYELQPGEKDQTHTHPPKVSYVLTGGDLRIVLDGGETFDVKETAGAASWMSTLGKHHAENIAKTPVAILLVEVKAANQQATPTP